MADLEGKEIRNPDGGQELLSELRELALLQWREPLTGLLSSVAPRLEEMEPEAMARLMGRMQRLQAFLRNRLMLLDGNIDAVSAELAQKMKMRGLASFDVPGVGRIWSDGMLLARLNPAQLEGAYRWLRDKGLGGMIKPQVNSATLRAQLKRHLQRGGERPPRDLITLELKLRARLMTEERQEARRLAEQGGPQAVQGEQAARSMNIIRGSAVTAPAAGQPAEPVCA